MARERRSGPALWVWCFWWGECCLWIASLDVLWFAPLLFLVIRPLAVSPVLLRSDLSGTPARAGELVRDPGHWLHYYLSFAVARGVPEPAVRLLKGIVLGVVATSIMSHGLSVKPLIRRYAERDRAARRSDRDSAVLLR